MSQTSQSTQVLLKRAVESWPYLLVSISIIGLIYQAVK
jgi:hypothetical protein